MFVESSSYKRRHFILKYLLWFFVIGRIKFRQLINSVDIEENESFTYNCKSIHIFHHQNSVDV